MLKGVISSKQIYFRPMSIDDIDNGWLDWINDQGNNKYLVNRGKMTRDLLVKYLNDSKPPSVFMFAICLIENDKYIGNARLSNIDWNKRCADYGRLIGVPNLQGKGIGTEVLVLLSYFAFSYLELNRIQTLVSASNIASVRSNEKAGAIQEGAMRKLEQIDDAHEDKIWFGMSSDDFKKSSWKEVLDIS